VVAGPEFRSDLYRGTAGYYDRFRVPYPPGLIGDLADRTGADGTGKLLVRSRGDPWNPRWPAAPFLRQGTAESPFDPDWVTAAAAKAAMDGNSQSGVTGAGGCGVAPQPPRSCRRWIHTVGSPAR